MRTDSATGELVLIVTPMLTGSVSALASLSVIISILRSNVKLTTAYRRVIFGISVFDLIQSLSQASSSMPMSAGTVWGAIGNDTTCDIQGFTTVIGVTGSLLYSLALSIYFLCVIKFEMTEIIIGKFAEPLLHIGPISISFSISIYMYIRQWYNPVDYFCWAVPSELLECLEGSESNVACIEESKGDIKLISFLVGFPVIAVLALNIAALGIIWHTEYAQSVRNRSPPCPSISEHRSSGESQRIRPTDMGPLAQRLSRPSRASLQRRKEIANRAKAYILGFLMTYLFSLIVRLWEIQYSTPAPFALHFLARFFYPLQGLFNLLIYTYPHTISQTRNGTHTYFQSLIRVIKSGGDSDRMGRLRSTGHRRRIRNTMRNEPAVTDISPSITQAHTLQFQRQNLDSAGIEAQV
jgi:hypothetical protein